MPDLADALKHLRAASRISGSKNSYRKDNPGEYSKVMAYLDGGARPSGVTTDMGLGLLEVEDVRRASVVHPPAQSNVPSSIASDCSVDVTSSLQSWIDSQPNGATLSFGSGCYRIEGTLLLTSRSNLTLQGGTFHSFNAPVDSRPIWRCTTSTGLVFQNMTIQGSFVQSDTNPVHDPLLQHSHGIELLGSACQIANVTVTDMAGDGFYFGLSGATRSTGRVTNSTVRRVSRNAVSLIACDNVQIRSMTASGIGYIHVDLEPNTGGGANGTFNSLIDSCTLGTYGLQVFSVVENALNSHAVFSNNHITATTGAKITIGSTGTTVNAQDISILNNTADNPHAQFVVNCDHCDRITITGNTFPMTGGGGMAQTDDCCSEVISGNSFPGGDFESEILNSRGLCP